MEKRQNKNRGGRPTMKSGKRIHVIKAKLTDEEIKKLLQLQRDSGLNRTALIRKRVLGGNGFSMNASEILALLDPIGSELGRAGNNINQLARHSNILSRQLRIDPKVVSDFNHLLEKYINIQTELEKALRHLLRKLKDS